MVFAFLAPATLQRVLTNHFQLSHDTAKLTCNIDSCCASLILLDLAAFDEEEANFYKRYAIFRSSLLVHRHRRCLVERLESNAHNYRNCFQFMVPKATHLFYYHIIL